eukprot:jgi/Chrpa1/8164/Chrysochromulina_OHIO_Genome00001639-RA
MLAVLLAKAEEVIRKQDPKLVLAQVFVLKREGALDARGLLLGGHRRHARRLDRRQRPKVGKAERRRGARPFGGINLE